MALLARWSADYGTYTDTGGTTAAGNGDAVAAWKVEDGVLVGALATQSTSGRRPILNTSDGGYYSLSGTSAAATELILAHTSDWVLTEFSWLAIWIPQATTNQGHLWGRGSSWGNAGAMQESAAAGFARNIHFHTNYAVRGLSTTLANGGMSGVWQAVGGRANGTEISSFVNTQSANRTSVTQTIAMGTNGTYLFSDGLNSSSYKVNQKFREIAFWNTMLSDADMETELAAAMARWGVTNTITVSSGSSGGSRLVGPSGLVGRAY